MTTVLSRDPARSRPPTDRPLDIVGAGAAAVHHPGAARRASCCRWPSDLGGDARAAGLPVPGLTAVLGLAVGAHLGLVAGRWLGLAARGGRPGGRAAHRCLVAAVAPGHRRRPTSTRSWGSSRVACAIGGIVAARSCPVRAAVTGRAANPSRDGACPRPGRRPARFSPPVQKVVDERLANVSFSSVRLSSVRLPAVRLPRMHHAERRQRR